MWYDFGRCMVSVEPWAEMVVNGMHGIGLGSLLRKLLQRLNKWHWDGLLMCAPAPSRSGHAAQEVMEPMCLAVMHDGQGNSQTIVNCCQPLGKGCLCPTSMTWGHKNTPPGSSSGPPTKVCTTFPVPLGAYV